MMNNQMYWIGFDPASTDGEATALYVFKGDGSFEIINHSISAEYAKEAAMNDYREGSPVD